MQSPHEDNPLYRYLHKDNRFMYANGQLSGKGKIFTYVLACWATTPVAWFYMPSASVGFLGNLLQFIFLLPLLALIPFLLVGLVHYAMRSFVSLFWRYFAPLVATWLLIWLLVFFNTGADGFLAKLQHEHNGNITFVGIYLPMLLYSALATWLEWRFAPPPKQGNKDILDDNYRDL